MVDQIIELFRHTATMFFGTFLSAIFLHVELNKKSILILSVFSALSLGIQGGLLTVKSVTFITMLYPLVVHLPLLCIFVLWFKKPWFHAVFAITTAYLCCQIANWVSIIPQSLHAGDMIINLTYTFALALTFGFIYCIAAQSFVNLYTKSTTSFLSFAIVPGFYYVFDYLFTVYSSQLYQNNALVVEFTPFLLCLCYMFFCTVYFKQYEEKLEMEQYNRMMHMQQMQSEKEIHAIRHSEQTISLLRHDLRHFLSTISEYLEQDKTVRAQEYIREIINIADDTKQKKYCSNSTVNMILSYYEEAFHEGNIQFIHDLRFPSEIRISDVDITSILSNGLENAMHAVLPLPKDRRIIQLEITERSGKLLISMENTFDETPIFVNDVPVAKDEGHGFGTQSILYTAQKLGGNCHFSLKGDRFILQLIL